MIPEFAIRECIKAGDVLMQRIVRDLFTLCSSALAVVPV